MNDFQFEPAHLAPHAYQYAHYMQQYGVSKAKAKQLVQRAKQESIFLSPAYQVNLTPVLAPLPFGEGTWISMKRLDKEPLHDRLALGHAMRALLPGYHGYELFPSPQRLVDTANQYHLWAFKRRCCFLDALLGEPLPHEGAITRALTGLRTDVGDIVQAVEFPALDAIQRQDWRVLQAAKDAVFPGCEAALLHLPYDVDQVLQGQMLVLSAPQARWPFGFSKGLTGDTEAAERMGARQRQLP